jgi:hypothetical protein
MLPRRHRSDSAQTIKQHTLGMNILSGFRSDKFETQTLLRHRAMLVLCAAAAVVCLLPAAASSLVRFDFEQRYFHEKPLDVLDHCVVELNGEYHLFYLRGNPAVNIGHAKTRNFVDWEILDPVLGTGSWDNLALWAPCIIAAPGNEWYMFYTGVNTAFSQQAGVALASNLYDWLKLPSPVYHPDPVWAEWSDSTWCHGRDPHVIEYQGNYYMFLTAKTNDNRGAIACAESHDLINWTDIGPLYVHDSWHVLESVFIMERNGKFHMFFTEEAVYGTSHVTCDSLFGDWDMANRRIIDPGHAPQITELSDGTEMFSRHAVYDNGYGVQYHTIRFDQLVWAGDIPAPYKPWALAGQWTLVWGNAFSFQPTFGNNPSARGENVADTYHGNCWIGTYERYTGPMGFGSPGNIQGDDKTGVIRSIPFTITGYSMNLLVGGGNDIDNLYVALVDAQTSGVLFKETGRNNEEMDRRYWNLLPYRGRRVYVEIADLSTAAFGHINCDDIVESWEVVGNGDGDLTGGGSKGNKIGFAPGHGQDFVLLHQNTPNPFNPTTSIAFDIPEQGHVALRVYDVGGRLVRTLVDGRREAGTHVVPWNGRDDAGRPAPSGIYLYRLSFQNSVVQTRKMMLLK